MAQLISYLSGFASLTTIYANTKSILPKPEKYSNFKPDPVSVVASLYIYHQIIKNETENKEARIAFSSHRVYVQRPAKSVVSLGFIRAINGQGREDVQYLDEPLKLFAQLFLSVNENNAEPVAKIGVEKSKEDTVDSKKQPQELAKKLLLGAIKGLNDLKVLYQPKEETEKNPKNQPMYPDLKESVVLKPDPEDVSNVITLAIDRLITCYSDVCEKGFQSQFKRNSLEKTDPSLVDKIRSLWLEEIKALWNQKQLEILVTTLEEGNYKSAEWKLEQVDQIYQEKVNLLYPASK
jgi:hypothetical protein